MHGLPDALGAIIVDNEGENVQFQSTMDEYALKLIGAYQVIHFDLIKDALVTELKKSDADTIITTAKEMTIISKKINQEYFFSLILKKYPLLGPAEFAMKQKLKEIKEII